MSAPLYLGYSYIPLSTIGSTLIKGDKGDTGSAGPSGVDGGSAFTTTTGDFIQPAAAATVAVSVADTSWMAVGLIVFIAGGGYYAVTNIPSSTSVILTNPGYVGNLGAGETVSFTAKVVPAGIRGQGSEVNSNLGTIAERDAYTPTVTPYFWVETDSSPPYQLSIWNGLVWI